MPLVWNLALRGVNEELKGESTGQSSSPQVLKVRENKKCGFVEILKNN